MPDPVISVENLGKKYILSHQQQRSTNLREVISEGAKTLTRRFFKPSDPPATRIKEREAEEFWALQNVSFEIEQGDVVGIIGGNGAGKSTLLKILSQITEPTTGRIRVEGRVASLLEVGTGFHPDLTGRENIYLNGAILGMGRVEIKRKFDEIVEFAEVEKFIDTAVKYYSSGMYVRLAFAVAAHLEPELLIVDEVLAVGDVSFQKKCLGKMEDIATNEGRTILLVSHNMGSIEALCTKAMLLVGGQIKQYGSAHDVVLSYLEPIYQSKSPHKKFANCTRRGNGKLQITSFHMESPEGTVLDAIKSGDAVVFVFGFENINTQPYERFSLGFSIHLSLHMGQEMGLHYGCLSHYASHFSQVHFRHPPDHGYVRCGFSEISLSPGEYILASYVMVADEEADRPHLPIPITVLPGDFYRTGTAMEKDMWGPLLVKGEWELLAAKDDLSLMNQTS